MNKVIVVIGAGSIRQAIARRVSTGKHVILADLRQENADAAAVILPRCAAYFGGARRGARRGTEHPSRYLRSRREGNFGAGDLAVLRDCLSGRLFYDATRRIGFQSYRDADFVIGRIPMGRNRSLLVDLLNVRSLIDYRILLGSQ